MIAGDRGEGEEDREGVADGEIGALAVGGAGDGEVDGFGTVGRDGTGGLGERLGMEAGTDADLKTLGGVLEGMAGPAGD